VIHITNGMNKLNAALHFLIVYIQVEFQ